MLVNVESKMTHPCIWPGLPATRTLTLDIVESIADDVLVAVFSIKWQFVTVRLPFKGFELEPYIDNIEPVLYLNVHPDKRQLFVLLLAVFSY